MFDVLEKSSLLAEHVQYSMELTCERALPTLIPMLDDSRIKKGRSFSPFASDMVHIQQFSYKC